tara:strand:- start:828 stop:1151 length:324 start_codon:yes stop_codon:yes gene_type:complete
MGSIALATKFTPPPKTSLRALAGSNENGFKFPKASSKSEPPERLKAETGLYSLVLACGLRNCKAPCFRRKARPFAVVKNLNILNLSTTLLYINPVIPGAPLTNPAAI